MTPEVSSDVSKGDGPCGIQHSGMFKPISESLAVRISATKDPMYKLDWKKSVDCNFNLIDGSSRSAVKFAMRIVKERQSVKK